MGVHSQCVASIIFAQHNTQLVLAIHRICTGIHYREVAVERCKARCKPREVLEPGYMEHVHARVRVHVRMGLGARSCVRTRVRVRTRIRIPMRVQVPMRVRVPLHVCVALRRANEGT